MVRDNYTDTLEDIKDILVDLKSTEGPVRDLVNNMILTEISYLKELICPEKEEASKAAIGPGTKVSWVDHIGAWSGVVTEVHYSKVRRVVQNISSKIDGIGYEHEITRVGTYANPALYIEIEGGKGGKALIRLNVLQIDELVQSN